MKYGKINPFFKWRKRDAHVPLHCHDTIEGSLKYWLERSNVDLSASNMAVWDDNAVAAALNCASSWVKGLPFVKSLSGHWKFHLASGPSEVPLKFHHSDFHDDDWGTVPELGRQPSFFIEINPQPMKHTLWQATTDFTCVQASLHREKASTIHTFKRF